MRFAAVFLFAALPALAQLDSTVLRAKFGVPLDREIFHQPQGFDLTVDYGASHQVCKLQVPALIPSTGKISNSDDMRQRMLDFLVELVPAWMRGNKIGGEFISATGAVVVRKSADYEYVKIDEVQYLEHAIGNDTITITFKNSSCPLSAGQ